MSVSSSEFCEMLVMGSLQKFNGFNLKINNPNNLICTDHVIYYWFNNDNKNVK